MPSYIVTDKETGEKRKLTGDSPPTDAELQQIFGEATPQPKQPGIAELGLQHPVAQFTEGLITGAENFRSGFRQLIDAGGSLMGAEPMYPGEQEAIAERDQRMSELGIIGQAGAIAGETAPSMMVPGGPAGGLGRRIAGGIATDVASSVADPVREGQTRAGNLAFAGGVSTGMRGITAPFSIAANKLANAKTDDLRDQAAKDLIATADAEDIRIFFDDVSGNPLASKISGAAEFFRTLGTGKGRELQNVDAARAADRWLSRFAGNQDEYTDVIQKGLEKKLRIFQGAATKKYQRAINKMGNPDVTTSRFDGALDSGIQAELAKGGRANDEVISLLQNYQNSPRGNFETMIEFRSDFNKDVSNLAFGNNPPNKTAKDALRRASKAIDDDMAEVAKANGAIDEWRAANKFYQNNVIQFQKGKLKNLVNEDSAANFDAQSAWRYLSQANANPKRAQRMWQALDVKGRAAVRQGLIEEAVEAASREGKPFSPAMFSAYLEKRMPVVEQFFRGKSREEIKGLAKVMRHIQKSGQYMEDPPTGQRLVPWLVGGVGYISPDVAVAGVASALATKGAFQTRTGRNFLLAASHASEGSAQMNNIIEQMNKFVARSARSEEDEK